MFACMFPFPVVAHWGFRHVLLPRICKKWWPSLGEQNKVADAKEENTAICTCKEAQVLLDTYQGAYKQKYSFWEGVIEMRKLVFCSFYLIQNNILRLVCCTLTSVLVLVHHIFSYPFAHVHSNRAETLSLSLLCVACVTNCVKSVFAYLGEVVEPNTPTEQLLILINRFERISIIMLISFILVVQLHDVSKKNMKRN